MRLPGCVRERPRSRPSSVRLVSLSAQEYVADILSRARELAKEREKREVEAAKPSAKKGAALKERRQVLTREDVAKALEDKNISAAAKPRYLGR